MSNGSPFRSDKLQTGFSLAELLIAGSILAVGLLGVYSMLPTAALNVGYTGTRGRGTFLAQQRIEQFRNTPFTTLALLNTAIVPPNPPAPETATVVEGGRSFTRRAWVQVSGAAPRREAVVTVIVEWPDLAGKNPVRLDTVIAE
jgi:hypothetical protein